VRCEKKQQNLNIELSLRQQTKTCGFNRIYNVRASASCCVESDTEKHSTTEGPLTGSHQHGGENCGAVLTLVEERTPCWCWQSCLLISKLESEDSN
jgi:hypothetical protein